ncbi:MAG: tetratricopeptide repeat protein, partial [Gammaproteobacteria bacterium]|nr:tetratricopeptide repeat protein [Gammaproteobacteria bacterium]
MAALLLVLGTLSFARAMAQESVAADTITIEVELTASQRATLADAERMIGAGDGAGAYRLLAPLEAELAGNALYDYLLGVAALDSGLPGEAIFSLRRSLAVAPAFSGATMELARAYFEAGNLELARPLFEKLLNENPPEPVRVVIGNYLVAIDQRVTTGPAGVTPFFEFSVGHDSNANGSTNAQQFLGFSLDPRNVETDSPYAEVAAGI